MFNAEILIATQQPNWSRKYAQCP